MAVMALPFAASVKMTLYLISYVWRRADYRHILGRLPGAFQSLLVSERRVTASILVE